MCSCVWNSKAANDSEVILGLFEQLQRLEEGMEKFNAKVKDNKNRWKVGLEQRKLLSSIEGCAHGDDLQWIDKKYLTFC